MNLNNNTLFLTTQSNQQIQMTILQHIKGCTNDNIVVLYQNQKYLLRKRNQNQIIFRTDELRSLKLLQQHNIQYTNEQDIILLKDSILIKFIEGKTLTSDFELSNKINYLPILVTLQNLHKIDTSYESCFYEEKMILEKIEAEKIFEAKKIQKLKFQGQKIHQKIQFDVHFSNQKLFKATFCHCDLHSGNIIFQGSETKFIDFEYARPAIALFDLTCFFAEFCGIQVDLSRYPSKQLKSEIFTSYQRSEIQWNSDFDEIVTYYEILTNLMWSLWGFHVNLQDYAQKRIQLAENLFMSF